MSIILTIQKFSWKHFIDQMKMHLVIHLIYFRINTYFFRQKWHFWWRKQFSQYPETKQLFSDVANLMVKLKLETHRIATKIYTVRFLKKFSTRGKVLWAKMTIRGQEKIKTHIFIYPGIPHKLLRAICDNFFINLTQINAKNDIN